MLWGCKNIPNHTQSAFLEPAHLSMLNGCKTSKIIYIHFFEQAHFFIHFRRVDASFGDIYHVWLMQWGMVAAWSLFKCMMCPLKIKLRASDVLKLYVIIFRTPLYEWLFFSQNATMFLVCSCKSRKKSHLNVKEKFCFAELWGKIHPLHRFFSNCYSGQLNQMSELST